MSKFNEAYFMRGQEEGVSNFQNYHWMPDATISMAQHAKRYLGLSDGDTLLDVGAARGYVVKAMRMLGVEAHGYDVSEWAIANCDPEVKPYMSNYLNGAKYDVVWCKDCAEHIDPTELRKLMATLVKVTNRRMFFIVPLAQSTGGKYVHEKEEKDTTHINRWTLSGWLTFFQSCTSSFIVTGGYRYPGLKPGAYEVNEGYGFITLERI